MTKRKIEYWVIPPEADAEFVAHMENVLDVYARPYDPAHPVVCMDEQPVQLVKETRPTIPGTKDHAPRVDYEYERRGTANLFLATEPLAGKRWVEVHWGDSRHDTPEKPSDAMGLTIELLAALQKEFPVHGKRRSGCFARGRGRCRLSTSSTRCSRSCSKSRVPTRRRS